jgi:hypothetical protein
MPPLKTTQRTIKDHEMGIPIAKLPQTLRDAVLATREMDINFIWTDALVRHRVIVLLLQI